MKNILHIMVTMAVSCSISMSASADSAYSILPVWDGSEMADMTETEGESEAETEDPGRGSLSESEEEISLSSSLQDLLIFFRLRYGADFTFAMNIPEETDPESGLSAPPYPLLTDYHEMREYPLPVMPKTIQMLEKQVKALTDSYSGAWSVYLKNLTTGEYFVINDAPMKSASVMKLFIMGTVYEAIQNQELERTSEITDLLTDMICYSSNEASNRLLYLLGNKSYADGISKVNDYIAKHQYTDMTHEYNGFEDPAAYCDTDHFNQISAKDCGLLLERIYRRTFGSRSICNEAEELMLNQHTRYKIPAGLPEDVSVGNKTGEMDTVENDVAVVYTDQCDYILCVLSNDWNSKDDAIFHIQEISATVYDFLTSEDYYCPDSVEDDLIYSFADTEDTLILYRTEEETESEEYLIEMAETELSDAGEDMTD